MAVGHITLDGREYIVPDGRSIVRSSATQMAAKLGSGAGEYDDLLNWEAWLMDNWQAGGGHKDPTDGGFLFATVDTRFDGHFSLPGFVASRSTAVTQRPMTPAYYDAFMTQPGEFEPDTHTADYAAVPVGAGQQYRRIGCLFSLSKEGNLDETVSAFDILLDSQDTTPVKVSVWSTNDGEPDEELDAVTITPTGRVGWHMYQARFDEPFGVTEDFPDGNFLLVVEPANETDTISIPTVALYHARHFVQEGDAWINNVYGFIATWHPNRHEEAITHHTLWNRTPTYAVGDKVYVPGVQFVEMQGLVYDADGTEVTSLFSLGKTLYIGLADGENYVSVTVGYDPVEADVPGTLFAMHHGFLWRAAGGSVFYTSDGSTWEEVILTIDENETITGIGGLNGELIVSTDRTLYRVTSGDVALFVTDWGAPSLANGKHMLNFQGNLYISAGESVIRFDGENMLPYGPDLGEGLPEGFAGEIAGLAANNNWLLCAVAGPTGSLWAHNGAGWHFVAELPHGVTATSLGYVNQSNTVSLFAVGTDQGMLYRPHVADNRRGLFRFPAENIPFVSTGWLETDWFHGGLREVEKDWESVYIDGEDITPTSYVDVYWQDDKRTDWTLLGRFTGPTNEVRFVDIRPTGRRIKVGIALHNSFQMTTPRVTAIRVKFMPMVTDRWRWQLPIVVAPKVTMVDGDVKNESVAAQLRHLDGLTRRVNPFIFEDIDGAQYEVKVMSGQRQVQQTEWNPGSLSLNTQYIYSLQVEQVTADAYAAA